MQIRTIELIGGPCDGEVHAIPEQIPIEPDQISLTNPARKVVYWYNNNFDGTASFIRYGKEGKSPEDYTQITPTIGMEFEGMLPFEDNAEEDDPDYDYDDDVCY